MAVDFDAFERATGVAIPKRARQFVDDELSALGTKFFLCPYATEDAQPNRPQELAFVEPELSLLTDNEVDPKKQPFVPVALVGGSGPEFLALDSRQVECPVVFWSYSKRKFLPISETLDVFLSTLADSAEAVVSPRVAGKSASLTSLAPHFGSVRRLTIPHGSYEGKYLACLFDFAKLSDDDKAIFESSLDGHEFLEDARYVAFGVIWSEDDSELTATSSLAEALTLQNEGILLFEKQSSSVALSDSGTTMPCVDELSSLVLSPV